MSLSYSIVQFALTLRFQEFQWGRGVCDILADSRVINCEIWNDVYLLEKGFYTVRKIHDAKLDVSEVFFDVFSRSNAFFRVKTRFLAFLVFFGGFGGSLHSVPCWCVFCSVLPWFNLAEWDLPECRSSWMEGRIGRNAELNDDDVSISPETAKLSNTKFQTVTKCHPWYLGVVGCLGCCCSTLWQTGVVIFLSVDMDMMVEANNSISPEMV